MADLGLAVAVGVVAAGASGRAVVAVATSAASAIKLDAVASPGYTVAVAFAAFAAAAEG